VPLTTLRPSAAVSLSAASCTSGATGSRARFPAEPESGSGPKPAPAPTGSRSTRKSKSAIQDLASMKPIGPRGRLVPCLAPEGSRTGSGFTPASEPRKRRSPATSRRVLRSDLGTRGATAWTFALTRTKQGAVSVWTVKLDKLDASGLWLKRQIATRPSCHNGHRGPHSASAL